MTSKSNHSEATRMKRIRKFLNDTFDIRYNQVNGKIELKIKRAEIFSDLDDYKLNSISVKLSEKNIKCSPGQLKDILISYYTPIYHPFEEYFYQLPEWDESTEYIELLADTIQTNDRDYWQWSFKKWIVAMVGSLLDDSVFNHTVLILAGNQGVGKSSWLFNIIPTQLKRYYFSGTIKISNKDTLVMLSEAMLINLEELAYLSRNELNELKEVVTKPQILLRRPYGRVTDHLPRRASFSGSVNEYEFLTDTTGSRRFLCFDTVEIDYQHKIDLDLVYAQAFALFKSGYKYWFDYEDISRINNHNEKFRIKSVEEELLMKTFEQCNEERQAQLLTASEVLDHLNKIYRLQLTNSSAQGIGKALRANNFKPVKRGGKQLYLLKELDQEKSEYQKRIKLSPGDSKI